jgi:hypothetical protein
MSSTALQMHLLTSSKSFMTRSIRVHDFDDHCLNRSIALLVSGGRPARSDAHHLQ